VPELQAIFPDLGMRVFPDYTRDPEAKPNDRQLIFTLDSDTITLAPGKAADLDLAIFAGPRDSGLFAQEPYATLGFGELLRYELGCTWCTFQWLARLLLGLLTGIHFVVRDWGVSIIILVLIVRGLLHPLTKGAQVRMMLTSKQMQALQPELEKVRTKYKGNAQKIQQETMRLYNEKGVNFANMLGCLPMLLQMPIWVALYAMLYFAIELRHQEAFYGVFQMISGGHWHFLESLSSSDRFIKLFDKPMPINLFMIVLDFQYFNILPILMGVVFFFQQKFMQPPPPENETPEAADRRKQQMMIMRIMMLTFPFFLYSAPSGLTLYILASTGAGILDSYLVRKHVKEKEAAGDLFKKKPVKPGGFRDRLHKMYEHRMKELQTAQKGKGGGRKR
jgi:YidC/Oxa1 family membrane protein insertase